MQQDHPSKSNYLSVNKAKAMFEKIQLLKIHGFEWLLQDYQKQKINLLILLAH